MLWNGTIIGRKWGSTDKGSRRSYKKKEVNGTIFTLDRKWGKSSFKENKNWLITYRHLLIFKLLVWNDLAFVKLDANLRVGISIQYIFWRLNSIKACKDIFPVFFGSSLLIIIFISCSVSYYFSSFAIFLRSYSSM